jgi:hypothetical protein
MLCFRIPKSMTVYDSAYHLAGSCQRLFAYSFGKGLTRYDEIVLDIGIGHGILFRPLDEWIIPSIEWARNP